MPYVVDLSNEAPMHIVGDLVGWKDKVAGRFMMGNLNSAFMAGNLWLDGLMMPDRLVIDKRRKTIPDGFNSNSSILVCSARVRDIIEPLDPGVHQFFPLEVNWRNGDPVGGEWYSFNVYARQDSVVLEESTLRKAGGPATKNLPAQPIRYYMKYHEKDVTLDEARLGALNLWRELRVEKSLLCSDTLHDALKSEGLRFFRSYKTKAAKN